MKLFISYCGSDREVADFFEARLTEAGYECLTSASATPGEDVASYVSLLGEATAFVLLISPQAISSQWQTWEWRTILGMSWEKSDNVIIALLLDQAEPPAFVQGRRCIRIPDRRNLEPAVSDLLRHLSEPGEEGGCEDEQLKPVIMERMQKVAEEISKLHMTEEDLENQKSWIKEKIERLTASKDETIDVANLQLKLAKVLKMQGRNEELVPVLEKGVEILERMKDKHPEKFTKAQAMLAKTLVNLNDPEGAFAHASRALATCEQQRQLQPQIPTLAGILAQTLDKVGEETAEVGRRILKSLEKAGSDGDGGKKGGS